MNRQHLPANERAALAVQELQNLINEYCEKGCNTTDNVQITQDLIDYQHHLNHKQIIMIPLEVLGDLINSAYHIGYEEMGL